MDRYMDLLKERLETLNPYEAGADYVEACTYRREASAVGAGLPFISRFISTTISLEEHSVETMREIIIAQKLKCAVCFAIRQKRVLTVESLSTWILIFSTLKLLKAFGADILQ